MLAHIVKIGNSLGVRLPKPVLDQTGLSGAVDLQVEGDAVVLRPVKRHPREGWAAAFKTMAEHGDDVLLDAEAAGTSRWDDEEWEWR